MSTFIPTVVAVALQAFPSAQAVAEHFETYLPNLPACREAGAVIFERQGRYFIRQINIGGAESVEMRSPRMQGDTIAGLVHIHPDCEGTDKGYDRAEGFSDADMDAARALNVPSYIVVTHPQQRGSTHLRVYVPHAPGMTYRGKVIK